MSFISNLLSKKTAASVAAIATVSTTVPIHTAIFPPNTRYELCFTPGNDCTSLIVHQIDNAHQSVYVQAYSFTSKPIAKAITNARLRGLTVMVILDKSQSKRNKYSSANFLIHHDIPVWIDYKPAIAHNKVMIIDDKTVITGSFNFTKAAEESNAENVLIIHDTGLAKQYMLNWLARRSAARQKIVTHDNYNTQQEPWRHMRYTG